MQATTRRPALFVEMRQSAPRPSKDPSRLPPAQPAAKPRSVIDPCAPDMCKGRLEQPIRSDGWIDRDKGCVCRRPIERRGGHFPTILQRPCRQARPISAASSLRSSATFKPLFSDTRRSAVGPPPSGCVGSHQRSPGRPHAEAHGPHGRRPPADRPWRAQSRGA